VFDRSNAPALEQALDAPASVGQDAGASDPVPTLEHGNHRTSRV